MSDMVEVTFEVEIEHSKLTDGTPYVKDVFVHTTIPKEGTALEIIQGMAVDQWLRGVKRGDYAHTGTR